MNDPRDYRRDYRTILRCDSCGRQFRVRVPWPLSAVLVLTTWINKWDRKCKQCLEAK